MKAHIPEPSEINTIQNGLISFQLIIINVWQIKPVDGFIHEFELRLPPKITQILKRLGATSHLNSS